MRFALLALCTSGCIAAGVKTHAGVMTDSRGWGLQAGIGGAFGYAGKRSAIVETIGFQGGERMNAGLAVGFDYVRLTDDKLGWRAGLGGVIIGAGDPESVGLRVASLLFVRERSSSGGHEKSWRESTRSIWALGVEGQVGMHTFDVPGEMRDDVTLGGTASVTFEIYMLSRMFDSFP